MLIVVSSSKETLLQFFQNAIHLFYFQTLLLFETCADFLPVSFKENQCLPFRKEDLQTLVVSWRWRKWRPLGKQAREKVDLRRRATGDRRSWQK